MLSFPRAGKRLLSQTEACGPEQHNKQARPGKGRTKDAVAVGLWGYGGPSDNILTKNKDVQVPHTLLLNCFHATYLCFHSSGIPFQDNFYSS